MEHAEYELFQFQSRIYNIHDVIFSSETIETSGKKQLKSIVFIGTSAFTFHRKDYVMDIMDKTLEQYTFFRNLNYFVTPDTVIIIENFDFEFSYEISYKMVCKTVIYCNLVHSFLRNCVTKSNFQYF